ncbi:MAG TPA: hypothetical protein ENJ95_15520 [Bacteroidetes bacterium]|nr:hypothetical protein [Bacteroidota bacterium]
MKATIFFQSVLCLLFLSVGCQQQKQPQKQEVRQASPDIVYNVKLKDLRLGDGVPLDLDVFLRWTITQPKTFFNQFQTADTFNNLVLYPRSMEMGATVANSFASVDSVFSSQREAFLATVKQALEEGLGEESMSMKEVIVSNIGFPASYTRAMEKVGLQRQLLEAIEQEKVIALQRAEAEKEKAKASSKVDIVKAEAEGRLANINAKTEESRRRSELAKAETQAQIVRKKAQAEADRNRLLAKAELEKKTGLKNLELARQSELDNLEIEKAQKSRRSKLADQIEFATVVQNNPVFANYLVNKELASKVGIAVVPTGTDANVFGNLLKQNMNDENN